MSISAKTINRSKTKSSHFNKWYYVSAKKHPFALEKVKIQTGNKPGSTASPKPRRTKSWLMWQEIGRLSRAAIETLKTRGMSSPEVPAEPVATASIMLFPGVAIPRLLRESTSWALDESTGDTCSLNFPPVSVVALECAADTEDWIANKRKEISVALINSNSSILCQEAMAKWFSSKGSYS